MNFRRASELAGGHGIGAATGVTPPKHPLEARSRWRDFTALPDIGTAAQTGLIGQIAEAATGGVDRCLQSAVIPSSVASDRVGFDNEIVRFQWPTVHPHSAS